MKVPVDDWQFWVVSALVLIAALWIARGLLPGRRKNKAQQRRATLTIGGKPVERSSTK